MIPYTYPKPYFDPTIYTDPKQPTKRLYLKPKEKNFEIRTWVPVGPTKWVRFIQYYSEYKICKGFVKLLLHFVNNN